MAAVITATGLGGIVLLAGCNMPAQASQGPRPPEKIYAKVCGYCHGKDIGPIIRGRALDTELVKYMVRHGKGGMPAFKPTEISPEELDNLAIWISESEADPEEHGQ
ncbi:MAG: cytochrome c [Sphingomonadaceae bacterium]|nr:cytochrome c [Sphingomonadaceae bacterium]